MDDTWRLKFSSTWTLPTPEILPSPLTPAIVPAMSSSSSANQMNMTNRLRTFPFVTQGYNVENYATSQESPIFPTLHLGVTDSGKKELSNPFLATTLHNLPNGISPLVKHHGHNGGTIVSNSCYAPQNTSIYPLNKSTNDSILNPRIHLLDESRLSLSSKSSKSPNFLSDLKFSPPNDRVVNNNQYHPFRSQMNTSRTSQTVTAKTATVVPSHESIHYRGRPRVICMGTVGELFLSELGILGVTCYCHNITMSVAKFCEHAGSSANVGHAVHLESGMTIAQWRKLCFGNTAPDDSKGWDWPTNSSTENCSVKYRATLPLHPPPVGHVKTFSGLANSLEEEYQTNNLVNAGYDPKGSYGSQSLFYPHPNSNSSISKNNFPSEEHKISVNGHSSNIDLRLGQPPQVHTYVSSSSNAMNPMQCKPEANHPLKEKLLAANCRLETKDPIPCFSYASHISFTCERGESQQAIMVDGNANKDLPISSLFQDCKSKMNNESHYLSFINSKCSTVDSSSNSLGGIFSYKIDKGKRPRCFENGNHDKQNTDIKAPRQSLGVQIVRSDNSTPDRSQLYVNFNQKVNMPVNNCTYNNPVNLISFNSGKSTIPTSTNSMHHSKTAFKSTHEQGINHGEKLFDGSMEQSALKSQRTGFHSGIDLQKDFCKGESEAMESSRQWSFHDIKQINGSAQSSSKYLCQNKLRKQAALTEDSSTCSKEQESFTCHACYVHNHPCLRLGKQIYDQKEQLYKKPFYGNCCSLLAKHLTSCCLYKDFISSSSPLNSQSLCGGAKIGHFPQICNEFHKFHDPKCENKKQNFTSGQPGLWRDVPAKKTDATSLKSSIGKVDKTAHNSDSKMEDQMSNICTGSPAPALTEVSVEVNREIFCSRDSYNRKSYEFVVDEESVVEKCGSSDEAAISECDKTNDVVANQDNNMKSEYEEQMEKISRSMNSEPSHCVGHVNLELFEHDQHTSPIQADNVRSSGLKRKEISCSLTEVFETSNKVQVIEKDQLLGTLAVPSEKNKHIPVQETEESNELNFRKPYKYISLNYIAEDDYNVKATDKEYNATKGKPVVCGKYGGLSGQKKPAKIVSLSSILKRTKKIYTNEYGLLCKKTISSKARKMSMTNNNEHNAVSSNDLKDDGISQNENTCGINIEENCSHHDCKEYQKRAGYKEIRSCSLSKLLATDHHTTLGDVSVDVKNSGKRYQNSEIHDGEPIQTGTERSGELNFDASCCVCGRANREEISVMLECHRCLIKVHQACYGVSEVPLGNWHCRPCKINSQSTGLLKSDTVKNPKPICARTEGFNGLKSEEAFNHSFSKTAYNEEKRCIVSQEQINAWAYINSLTSCRKTPLKQSSPDTDYDTRVSYNNNRYSKKLDTNPIHLNQTQKEYFRYKQSKAWKNLVVYKSGIHSFGLYSSESINRGTMVVEYVGEIIGQKVADKREKEYELSNGLQYKSACYFFRIDKDNIIDATRKGGIARFVNHSCQPNCVAKIITVRSEKKVVFFATRDINPGEEVTYDYHFNSEDEGEKIPCYCNSKNCRRYLN